LILFKEQ